MANTKTNTLKAGPRAGTGSGPAGRLRRAGRIPGVHYGGKEPPANLEFQASDVDVLLNNAVGDNILVELEVEGGGRSTALIQEVQRHPVTGDVLHLDLLAVSMDEEITTEVAVEPEGESVGVKNYGGLLEQNIRQIEVACLPANLPDVILVDVSALGIGETIHIGDIRLPDGVRATQDSDWAVFHVTPPRVDTGAAAGDEGGAREPEVLKEKKEEGGTD